jgi:hypothetical protein
MHIMAYIHHGLFVVISFVALALSQQDDPVEDLYEALSAVHNHTDIGVAVDDGVTQQRKSIRDCTLMAAWLDRPLSMRTVRVR